ncbi:MAG: GGDEF domain-containing protein [Candidatus Saccharimonadales bacterium]
MYPRRLKPVVEAERPRNPAAGSVMDKTSWHETVKEAVSESHRDGSQIALIFIDIDQMKYINDSFGHDTGDRAIDIVLKSIQENLRHTVTRPEEMHDVIGYTPASQIHYKPGTDDFKVGNLGGDEFGILCRTDEQGALALVQRLRETIQKEVADDLRLRDLEVSVGVSVLQPGMSASELLRLADHEMYEDKLGRMPELNEDQKDFLRQIEAGLEQHNIRLRDIGKHLLRLARESDA